MKRDYFILDVVIFAALAAITLAAFHGVGTCGFVNYDDPGYILDNPHVTSGLSKGNFAWAWTTFEQGNYLPLTWLSLMLDVTLFGPGPRGFHWVNLGFHIANALLVYWFFRSATGSIWRSALAAAIFAVHPLRVESVVWIVERKDVLTTFFWLLAALAYLRYARTVKWRWYAATLLLFAAALLAKQTLATLPFVLLLLDYWPLGRWIRGPAAVSLNAPPRQALPRLVAEKLPMLAMAAAIMFVTVKAQASFGAVQSLSAVPLAHRLANVPISYVRYLSKMVWFSNLAVYYPLYACSAVQIVGACLLLAAVCGLVLWKLRPWPWLAVGWFWFLGMLVPMIGVAQFGSQSMADRFTYVSGIGLLVMVAWSVPAALGRRPVLAVAAVFPPLSLLIVFTIAQTRYWQNSVALFRHDIAVAGSSPVGDAIFGSALAKDGKVAESIAHLKIAVKLNHKYGTAQGDLAIMLAKNNQCAEALPHITAAVRLEPNNVTWRTVHAYLLLRAKRYEEAARASRTALALDPRSAVAHNRLGVALRALGNGDEALDQFKLALAIDPDYTDARDNLRRWQASIKSGVENH